jgi:hypothetical protein
MSGQCTTSPEITETNDFTPSQKEIEQFEKDKYYIYRGTFVVCLVYGLIALAMILVIFLTDWGRDYIYGKMLPAVATFVFGALFIIIYLSMNIYDLKPRRIRNKSEMDQNIVCPDYWKLELVSNEEKVALIDNNKQGNIFSSIQTTNDDNIMYKCKIDPNVLEINTLENDANILHDNQTFNYKAGYKKSNSSKVGVDYVYVDKTTTNPFYTNDNKLANYAKFSGMYHDQSIADATLNNQQAKVKDATVMSGNSNDYTNDYYKNKKPLICNTVYPQVLADLDKNTPEQNKYRCMYAKACNIPWTGIGCRYEAPALS